MCRTHECRGGQDAQEQRAANVIAPKGAPTGGFNSPLRSVLGPGLGCFANLYSDNLGPHGPGF